MGYLAAWAGPTGWRHGRLKVRGWNELCHDMGNGPTHMTPAIIETLLAVTVVIGIGVGILMLVAARKARAEALLKKEPVREIDPACATSGHAYSAHETGYRCRRCGNHVSSREGELYGLAQDGRQERRREPR